MRGIYLEIRLNKIRYLVVLYDSVWEMKNLILLSLLVATVLLSSNFIVSDLSTQYFYVLVFLFLVFSALLIVSGILLLISIVKKEFRDFAKKISINVLKFGGSLVLVNTLITIVMRTRGSNPLDSLSPEDVREIVQFFLN